MKLAIVVPRFGFDIGGGAETHARWFALEAARRGWQVEAWTTCAHSHYTWENSYPAGESWDNGIRVLRFPVEFVNIDKKAELESYLGTRGGLSRQEQYQWLEIGSHSPGLYRHILQNAAAMSAIIVMPYANPMMHLAAWCAPEKTHFIACLHNEPYAYMEPTHLILETVQGILFNTLEEEELALQKLHIRPRHHTVLGVGVPIPEVLPTPQVGEPPFILLITRLEEGKNVLLVYEYAQRYWDNGGRVKLVVTGSGPIKPPVHPGIDFRGFVSEEEKNKLCASALAMCQPSVFESFGITLLESWIAGRPVLVHGYSPVTRGHARRSEGGLWFRDYEEFAAALDWFNQHREEAQAMGLRGREYVLKHYTWPILVDQFEQTWQAWQQT
ncbi:MAG: glycosyltransferase family 4 protein [Chloroflexi bacterium]|nr:glycosyltransferase family 4 protein [Chloroflexota bacterium]MBP8057746.1 glycosyltransferase family 4 protein [Chloroflexota bacterium]